MICIFTENFRFTTATAQFGVLARRPRTQWACRNIHVPPACSSLFTATHTRRTKTRNTDYEHKSLRAFTPFQTILPRIVEAPSDITSVRVVAGVVAPVAIHDIQKTNRAPRQDVEVGMLRQDAESCLDRREFAERGGWISYYITVNGPEPEGIRSSAMDYGRH